MTDLQFVIVIILAAPFWLPLLATVLVGAGIAAAYIGAALFRASTMAMQATLVLWGFLIGGHHR